MGTQLSLVDSAEGGSAPGGPPPGEDAQVAQFVTFQLGGENFAVSLLDVQEIIRLPDLVSVPLSPSSLAGIANLRGAVLPIASLRRIFDMEDVPHDEANRVVVINSSTPAGLIVDRIAQVVSVDVADIEEPSEISASISPDIISGVIRIERDVVMIISPPRLLAAEFKGAAQVSKSASTVIGGQANARGDDTENPPSDEVQLVSFVVDEQEYAFPIENVEEIVTVPSNISRVPNSDSALLGVITLRERLLALVSMRSIFGLPPSPPGEQNRIVVVSVPGANGSSVSVGVVMDTVKAVLRVQRSSVDTVPPAITRGRGNDDINGICRLSGGERLVSILSAEKMLKDIALALPDQDEMRAATGQGDDDESDEDNTVISSKHIGSEKDDEEELVVVFKLAGGEYGVPVHAVKEIVRVPEELTQIPRTPAFIEGVVNLRGAVLPVIDKRTRLGLEPSARSERQRIIVLILDGRQTGFVVDSVSEVLKVQRSRIKPAPELSEEQAKLINWVVNLEENNRVILLVEVSHLLNKTEFDAIAQAA